MILEDELQTPLVGGFGGGGTLGRGRGLGVGLGLGREPVWGPASLGGVPGGVGVWGGEGSGGG